MASLINTTAAPDLNDSWVDLFSSLTTVAVVVFSLVSLLGVLGNGLVIWVTGFRMKKTVNTIWYLHIAVADFIFAVFLALRATSLALQFHWPFGNFMCKLCGTLIILNLYASVYIMVVISVDRCVSVVWPVWAQNHRNVRSATYVSLCVWMLALIVNIQHYFYMDTKKETENTTYCSNIGFFEKATPTVIQTIVITHFLLGFAVPLTVIVSCYAPANLKSVNFLTVNSGPAKTETDDPKVADSEAVFRDSEHSNLPSFVSSKFENIQESDDLISESKEEVSKNTTYCFSSVEDFKYATPSVFHTISITHFLLGFAVPFTVIVACYAVIIHRLRTNRNLASQSSRPFKVIASIIVTFFLCWGPYYIIDLIQLVVFIPPNETFHYAFRIVLYVSENLVILHCCLNPLLYVFLRQDFKAEIQKSILNVLESAFQEEETRSPSDMKSVNTRQSREKSDLITEV
uniref:Formyl peptide receptor 1 n=1 Tax=Maylandia zebra TaxID=106582 RepID=A0A3P9C4D3_9CICH